MANNQLIRNKQTQLHIAIALVIVIPMVFFVELRALRGSRPGLYNYSVSFSAKACSKAASTLLASTL